jgi:hypothetical protein
MTLCGIYWYPPQCLVARVGLESSLSQGIRRFDLRRSRSIGLARPHIQQQLNVTTMHVVRVIAWFWGEPIDERRRKPGTLPGSRHLPWHTRQGAVRARLNQQSLSWHGLPREENGGEA